MPNKIYIVRNGDPFAGTGNHLKYFSTEEKARRFIEEDCERIKKLYNLDGEAHWDSHAASVNLYYYKCGALNYAYYSAEVL